jgi:hypothetical protein
VDDLRPPLLDQLRKRQLEIVERALVDVVELAVRLRGPDLVRLRLGQEPVALLALASHLRELLFLEQYRLLPELLVLLVQLDEDRDLGQEDLRIERLEDVVDSARRVAAKDLLLVLRDRRYEDDRHVTRALALLDQRRGLEAVELGHLHVEEDHGDLVAEELPERLVAGVRVQQRLSERREDAFEREQVLRPVVDEEDVRHLGLGPRWGNLPVPPNPLHWSACADGRLRRLITYTDAVDEFADLTER